MILIDSHCHLDKINYKKIKKNIYQILEEAKKKNIKYILNVSTSINNFDKMNVLLKNKKNIFYSCGIHPFYYKKNIKIENIRKRLKNKKVIAVGEIGLDYSKQNKINKEKQKKMFLDQIKISKEFKKPIIVHTRNSIKDTIKILKISEISKYGGIIHSFNQTKLKNLKKIIDLNFYISISGIITFKNASELRNIIKYIPLNKILIETDSPYLSPEPHRGKENQPSNLYYIAKCVAKLKKIKLDEISEIMKENFKKLFNLNKKLIT
ncbi:TatD family hydrolase [Buchnera aphidicola (Pseudoregma panicola)]|uniref:TatD family hydrolase n=1 Tax=Buchnera aphidicola TaxID=9 RepID=UPI0031B71628